MRPWTAWMKIGALAAALDSSAVARGARQEASAEPTALRATPGVGAAPTRLALLVGIDEYSPAAGSLRPATLSGAKNDIARARALLIGRFGFSENDIVTLQDAQATHAAVVQAFHDHLIARAGPETEALFWYSGHGSLAPDAAAREEDGKDNTLVCFDSRDGGERPGFDLTDDELYSLRRALAKRTTRITFVLDSCHAGGATRGGGEAGGGAAPSVVRFAESAKRSLRREDVAAFWPNEVDWIDDDDPRRGESVPHVALSACTHRDPAHEHPIVLADGTVRTHGAFTWFLCDALERAEPGLTYATLARRTALDVSNHYRNQQVQAEGDLDRKLFAGEFGPPPRGFAAELAADGRSAQLFAGTLQLLRVGSQVELSDDAGASIGLAEVVEAGPNRATARLPDSVAVPPARRAVRATEVARPPGAPPLEVFVAAGAQFDDLAARLAASEAPRFCVFRDLPRTAALAIAPRDDGRFGVMTLPDRLVAEHEDWPTLLANAADELRYRELLALASTRGGAPIKVEFAPIELAGDPATRTLLAQEGGGVWIEVPVGTDAEHGAALDLRVTLDAKGWTQPMHVAVLCISEDRAVAPIYPVDGATDNRARPGEPLTIRLSVFPTVIPGLERPAVDRLLVIATETPADFKEFQRGGGVFMASTEEPARFRGDGSRLPVALQDALAPCRTVTRGVRMRVTEAVSWGVAALDMRVVERGTERR